MKKCSRCNEEKSTSEFGVRRASKDGLSAACKLCMSIYDKKRANEPSRVAARLAYSKTDEGRESRRRATKKYELIHKDRAIKSKQDWSDRNKKKRKVHHIVSYAITTGFLRCQPCEVCGKEQTHAHHDDYDKPLDVRWLCSRHHQEWHAENGPGLNGD